MTVQEESLSEDKAIIIKWLNPDGRVLRVYVSNNEDISSEVRFYYKNGIRLPYYRLILFNNGKETLPSELRKFIKNNRIVFHDESLFKIQNIIRKAFLEESDWCMVD